MKRPARFVGLHFFNPVPLMALVEVVPADRRFDRRGGGLAESPRQDAGRGEGLSGLRGQPAALPMLNEAVLAYGEGIARRHIDEAMKLGCNHPIGPLALADLIGLDVLLAVMEVFHREFKDPKYRPAPLLKEMVADGKLAASPVALLHLQLRQGPTPWI